MQIYHIGCPKIDTSPNSPQARMRMTNQSVEIATRTYTCEQCYIEIHIDMDWEEGATPEPTARLD